MSIFALYAFPYSSRRRRALSTTRGVVRSVLSSCRRRPVAKACAREKAGTQPSLRPALSIWMQGVAKFRQALLWPIWVPACSLTRIACALGAGKTGEQKLAPIGVRGGGRPWAEVLRATPLRPLRGHLPR